MLDVDRMTHAERQAYANELERQRYMTFVPEMPKQEVRHLVLIPSRKAEVFW